MNYVKDLQFKYKYAIIQGRRVPMKVIALVLSLLLGTAFAQDAGAKREAEHKKRLDELRAKLAKKREERRRKDAELVIKAQIVNEQFYAEQPTLRERFVLDCPVEEDKKKVLVHEALRREYIYWQGGGKFKIIFRRALYAHRIENPYTNIPIDIYNEGERVVSNLCPGGGITVVRSLEFLSGQMMNVVWTVKATYEGKIGIATSSPGQLTTWDSWWEAPKNRAPWIARIPEINEKF